MNGTIDHNLIDLAIFVRVTDAGSFSGAARQTKTPQATISRRIARLEERLGTRLLNRTTRSMVLTEAGRRVYEPAKLMVEQGEAAAAALSQMQAKPSGTLKITSTVVLGHNFLSALSAEFMALYPDVSIQMTLTTRRVDIVQEGYDIALRIGALKDSQLALTHLCQFRTGLYASANYLRSASPIHHPLDLTQHAFLFPANTLDPRDLELIKADQRETVSLRPRLSATDTVPILAAAHKDLGIAQLPRFIGQREVEAGRCIEVLSDWTLPEVELNALTPSFKGELPAVREFLRMAGQMFTAVD